MIIKKYQASTEKEAILLAKEELGKEAIVLNIKTITPKGLRKLFQKPKVEILAAMDEGSKKDNTGKHTLENKLDTQPLTSLGNIAKGISVPSNRGFEQIISDESLKTSEKIVGSYKNPKYIDQNSVYVSSTEANPFSMEEGKTTTSAIEEKLNNLQFLLEKELTDKKEQDVVKEPKDDLKNVSLVQLVYNQLLKSEVDEKYVEQLMGEIESKLTKETTLDSLLASLYQKIILKLGQPKTIELEENKLKFVYFIGPTGVGKTTTIAKIASTLKLNKKAKVALLTSDTYRIAAVEQLRIYANILDIPMKVIYTQEDVNEAKKEFCDYDVVLIDTAGRSHKSREQKDNLNVLINAVDKENRETYLVLSATTKYRDLKDIADLYSEITDYRLIFTKLDETCCVGNIYNLKQYTRATLSYTTNGQNVPEDIEKINAQETAKKLLGGNE